MYCIPFQKQKLYMYIQTEHYLVMIYSYNIYNKCFYDNDYKYINKIYIKYTWKIINKNDVYYLSKYKKDMGI